MATNSGWLTIREVSKRTQVPSKTLRYWEEIGVLLKPKRSSHDYRLYPPEVLERVAFIQKAKSVGFTLTEIRNLFQLAKQKRATCADVVSWAGQKIRTLEDQIALLSQIHDRLIAYQKEWESKLPCPPLSANEICCLIEGLPLKQSEEGQRDAERLPAIRKRAKGPD